MTFGNIQYGYTANVTTSASCYAIRVSGNTLNDNFSGVFGTSFTSYNLWNIGSSTAQLAGAIGSQHLSGCTLGSFSDVVGISSTTLTNTLRYTGGEWAPVTNYLETLIDVQAISLALPDASYLKYNQFGVFEQVSSVTAIGALMMLQSWDDGNDQFTSPQYRGVSWCNYNIQFISAAGGGRMLLAFSNENFFQSASVDAATIKATQCVTFLYQSSIIYNSGNAHTQGWNYTSTSHESPGFMRICGLYNDVLQSTTWEPSFDYPLHGKISIRQTRSGTFYTYHVSAFTLFTPYKSDGITNYDSPVGQITTGIVTYAGTVYPWIVQDTYVYNDQLYPYNGLRYTTYGRYDGQVLNSSDLDWYDGLGG